MIIKALLVGALAVAAYLLVHGRRSALSLLVRRSLALTAIGVGVVAVLLPDATTAVAHQVGVGRGTDLVLYLLCVTFLFTTIGLHLRLTQLHDQFVVLARRVALDEAAREPGTGHRAEAATQRSSVSRAAPESTASAARTRPAVRPSSTGRSAVS